MPPTLDISNHFRYFHNTEVVTVRRRVVNPTTSADTFSDTSNVLALREATTNTEADVGQGSVSSRALTFHLQASSLSNSPPKPRDWIKTSADVEYVIQRVEVLSWETRYRCECERVH